MTQFLPGRMTCGSQCIYAAETSVRHGFLPADTNRLPRKFSAGSTSMDSSWNTTLNGPAVSNRCGMLTGTTSQSYWVLSLQSMGNWRIRKKRSEEHTSELQSRFDIVC